MATETPSQPEEHTYTAMETADVQAIGAHCQMPFCGQLDFLPFRCESCKSTYCLDHRSETAHKCTHAGEWARNRRLLQSQSSNTSTTGPLSNKPTVLTAQQCSDPSCKTFINTTQSQAVHCTTCNRQYCLKHRFPEDHNCKNLTPQGARPAQEIFQSNADKIRQGFGKLRSWGREKQASLKPVVAPKAASRAAQVAALNTLKRNAKGDSKIAVEKRVYLHVEAAPNPDSATHKAIVKPLYFSSEWPVGRLLDEAARSLGVQNVNNSTQGEEQRLRVYHVESGRVVPFSEKVGTACQSGNTVVLLRGIGDPEAEVEAVRSAQD